MKRMMTIALLVVAGFLSAKSAAAHVQPSELLRFVQYAIPLVPATAICLVNAVIFPED
jgi:uncharacterized membrane protein YdjX (TVP38/TMEM64 family)